MRKSYKSTLAKILIEIIKYHRIKPLSLYNMHCQPWQQQATQCSLTLTQWKIFFNSIHISSATTAHRKKTIDIGTLWPALTPKKKTPALTANMNFEKRIHSNRNRHGQINRQANMSATQTSALEWSLGLDWEQHFSAVVDAPVSYR